jgi:hypothetical protein
MPITIERKIKGPQTIYRQAEADAGVIAYVPWKEAQPGLWALTDDGYVARCEARKEYTGKAGKTTIHLRFSFGAAWLPRTKELHFLPFHHSGNYGGTSPRSWQDLEAAKERTRRTVVVFAEMLVSRQERRWGFAVGPLCRRLHTASARRAVLPATVGELRRGGCRLRG